MTSLSTVVLVFVLMLSVEPLRSGDLSLGSVVLFALYTRQLQQPLSTMVGLRFEAANALAALDRVHEVLDFRPATGRRPDAQPATSTAPLQNSPVLEFTEVSFEYPAARNVVVPSLVAPGDPGDGASPVLNGISFRLNADAFIAFVGATGAGKSTIGLLAAGILEATSGAVCLRGRQLEHVDPRELSSTIAYVAQDAFLFHDTIASNLRYGAPQSTSMADVIAACAAVGLHDFIRSLPAGYNTVVGDRGARLSGGERQRLSLARAILRQPSVLILDEATAHLDSRTEQAIEAALHDAFATTARLVIAHRLATVVSADEIHVVDRGRIIESGCHAALVACGGPYSRLYEAQRLLDDM